MRHITFSAMLLFMLASCSQQASEYNQTKADSLMSLKSDTLQQEGADSVKEEVAVVDSTCDIHVVESEGVAHDTFRFKIVSPIKGYESYKWKDKFICKYNKWTYSPDAEYVIIESKSSESEGGCECSDREVYRNGVKVMYSYESECEDNGSSRVTYFYADGTIAADECASYDGIDFDEYSRYEDEYVIHEEGKSFSRIRMRYMDTEEGDYFYDVISLSYDTLTLSTQGTDEDDTDLDIHKYLVVEKGDPAPEVVRRAARSSVCVSDIYSSIKFVKKIE